MQSSLQTTDRETNTVYTRNTIEQVHLFFAQLIIVIIKVISTNQQSMTLVRCTVRESFDACLLASTAHSFLSTPSRDPGICSERAVPEGKGVSSSSALGSPGGLG